MFGSHKNFNSLLNYVFVCLPWILIPTKSYVKALPFFPVSIWYLVWCESAAFTRRSNRIADLRIIWFGITQFECRRTSRVAYEIICVSRTTNKRAKRAQWLRRTQSGIVKRHKPRHFHSFAGAPIEYIYICLVPSSPQWPNRQNPHG